MKTNKEVLKNEEERKERSRSSYSELPEDEESSPAKATKKFALKLMESTSRQKESRKGNKENREIKILKRSKTVKEKSDPERFSGDGINFKSKIIGIEHVFDARGNRMCQGALQRLKAAVKSSGDHKQKIILNISLNGIIIKDEKSGEILHHHPIHKISFISQDTSDSRAFGYVFGCPQTGHRFFAIKTEKTASQVVVTLRDLFLVALELKKKEIEKAKKEKNELEEDSEENMGNKVLSNGSIDESAASASSSVQNGCSDSKTFNHELLYSNTVSLPEEDTTEKHEANVPEAETAVDNLLDLQFEMDTLQQGITQMDHSIASAVSQGFGFSFSEDDVSESSSSSIPLTFQFKLDKLSSLYQETLSISSRSSSASDYNTCTSENKQDTEIPKNDLYVNTASTISDQSVSASSVVNESNDISSEAPTENNDSETETVTASAVEDRYAVFLDIDSLPSIFDNPDLVKTTTNIKSDDEVLNFSKSNTENNEIVPEVKSSTPIAFAELDPLGNQPYVDKKDFFQDIKNPPKKVLKDLVSSSIEFQNSVDITSGDTELFHKSSEPDMCPNEFQTLGSGDLGFPVGQKQFNPFDDKVNMAISRTPPKLPPKRSASVASPFPTFPEILPGHESLNDGAVWEAKNPFNPFVCEEYPDIPPPCSPPPPPPPRLPAKVFEPMSPPPPRPPSRTNGVPTPPLPKRRVPFAATNRTWFSFDQDAIAFSTTSANSDCDQNTNFVAPPIPSPARKLPPARVESPILKSSSASNSPATMRRLYNHSPHFGNTVVLKEIDENMKQKNITTSPRKILTQHSSVIQESDFTSNPFAESNVISDSAFESTESLHALNNSPPLPPKPATISRPRPSPTKKMLSTASGTSKSSSSISVTETTGSPHSSSSLMFSSTDENKIGSSSEALFLNSSGSQSEVFSQSSVEIVEKSSNNASDDLSPDSIFRRKSDPFADDFFLSLPKKSTCDKSALKQNCSNGVEAHFEDLEAPT